MPDETDSSASEPESLLDEAVLEYTYRVADGEELDLEDFCSGYPDSMRDALRERCLEALRIQQALRRGASDPPEPGTKVPGADGVPLGSGRGPYRDIGGYHVRRELGRGAMGVVYLARTPDDSREVALKVLALNPAVATRTVERFRREMTAAAKLHDPGIVEVFAVGEDQGLLYMVMEYVEGETLEQILERARRARQAGAQAELPGRKLATSGSGTIARAADIAAQVAEALHYAHGVGIIHRDIKPGNIIIDTSGRPRLLDFGLAKDLSEVSLSSPGDLAGTPCYMSPEQAMSKRVKVDHRSDVFSLGVVLYELLSLRRPFGGDTLQRLFFEISFKEPDPLQRLRKEIPQDLVTICEKAMSKDPDHRFQTAGEMAQDLRRFLNHESIVARPVGAARRLVRRARQQPALLASGSLLALVLIASPFALGAWGRHQRVLFARERAAGYIEEEPYGLNEINRALASLRAEEALRQLEPDPASEAGESLARLVERRVALADAMRDFVESADDPRRSYLSPEVLNHRLASYALLAPILRSGSYEAAFVEDPSLSRLSVRSDPPGATVYLEPLGRLDDARLGHVYLGTTPLAEVPFEPGRYRVVLEVEGFGYAEYTRELERPGESYELDAIVRRSDEVVRDMLLLEDATFVFGIGPEDRNWPMHERRMNVGALYVDRDEVTSAEYLEYVRATGARRPTLWPAELDGRWLSRPVVGIDRREAQAYAEWAGKRLPTLAEWQRLSRGTDGRLYPRGEVEFDAEPYALYKLPAGATRPDPAMENATPEGLEALRRAFLEGTQPIGAGLAGRGPEGIDHTLGNVAEWTESFWPTRNARDGIELEYGQACVPFGSWAVRESNLTDIEFAPPTVRDSTIGIRCVKSVISVIDVKD